MSKPSYEQLEQRIKKLELESENLRKTEEELSQIFSMSLDMICIADINTASFLKVNPAFTGTLGFTEKELLAKSFLDFVHPDDVEPTLSVIDNELLQGAKVINFENRYRCKDGSYRWLSWVSHPNPAKGITYAVARDVTEKRKVESEIHKVKALLDATGRMARVGGWELDAETLEVTWTDETYRIHEVPLGQKPSLEEAINFFHPEDRGRLSKAIQRALDYGEPYDLEIRFITKKGKHLWTRTICQPQVVNGKIVKLLGTFQDITDREQAKETLKESEERYRGVIEDMPVLISSFLPNGEITFVNKSYCKYFGKTYEELVGSNFLSLIPELERKKVLDNISSLNADSPVIAHEHEVISPSGATRWQRWTNRAILNDLGEVVSYQAIGEDVTERKQIEKELKKSEKLLKKAQRVAKVGHWELDSPSGAPIWSEEIFHIFGLDPRTSEPSFAAHENIIHKDDWGTLEYAINKLSETGKPFDLEFRINNADGGIGWMHAMGAAEKDNHGNVIRMFGTAQDISDRKRIEIELQESLAKAEFLADIIEKTHQPLGIGYPDGRLGFCNKAFCELTGYTFEELKVMDWAKELTPPEWLPSEMEALRQLERTGKPVQYEKEYLHKDGSRIPIHMLVHVVQSQGGEPNYYYAFVTDITERKLAEKKILEEKIQAERYLNLAGVMFIGLDNKGHVNVANEKACEVLECNESEVINKNWFDNFIPETIRDDVRSVFKQLMEGKLDPVEYYENPVITKSGKQKNIAWHNTFIKNDDGKVIGILGSGEDITDKLRLQAQLNQAQKIEAIGTLAGGIAHDFNNVLGIIVGNIELASDDILESNPAHLSLNEARKACLRAKDMVKQILAFSRQETSELKPIDIKPIVEEVMKMMRASIPTTIDIHQDISKQEAMIMGDPTQIHQVLINLCTNASQAMDEMGSILQVGLASVEFDKDAVQDLMDLSPGRYIRLTVSDTGHGIEPGIIGKIFDPYFTTKEVGKGTGMGLAAVHGIVKDHGGTVTVYSEAKKGTTFHVFFPELDREIEEDEIVQDSLLFGNETILFVDDEVPLANLGNRMLESLGYKVESRTSSIEALEAFRANPDKFDAVVTDMTMPNMTGEIFAKELMRLRPDIPIILCTGFSHKINEEKALDIGIKGFVMKPLIRSELANTVRRVLDEK